MTKPPVTFFTLRYPAPVLDRINCAPSHRGLLPGCRGCELTAHALWAVSSGDMVLARRWEPETEMMVLSGVVTGGEGKAALARMVALARGDVDPVGLPGWPHGS